ncbi:MAG TPA: hypothetical protein VNT30_02675 [Stellaceae bacterium]|nr:hypothetical protein [Stellaceae bacterium]
MTRLLAVVFGIVLMLASGAAMAQAPTTVRVRGMIDALSGDTLKLTTRTGDKVSIALAAGYKVTALTAISITAIKPGSYIGTAAMRQADGSLKALEVQVFPEAMRGVGEGSRPFDVAPNSSMTNGTVGDVVGTDGRVLTVKYNGKETKVVVPADVPIVTYEPGEPTMLTPGAHVFISVTKSADGTMSAERVTVGKDGLVPPM